MPIFTGGSKEAGEGCSSGKQAWQEAGAIATVACRAADHLWTFWCSLRTRQMVRPSSCTALTAEAG